MSSYRYPGPRPFQENDINLFFGRKKDTENLLTFINVEQLVVLFSKSGIGKSSLINAGILPELRKKDYDVIVGRFNSFVNSAPGKGNAAELLSPVNRLLNEIKSKDNNTATFLDPLLPGDKEPSLWHQFKNLQIANKEKTFFIFFDQFEELFTYPADQVIDFKEQLAELLYTAVPQHYLDRIDKFEDDPSAAHLTNEQLELLYEPIHVKILFTIRSDKFSSLTKLKDAIPGIVTKTYELKPFSISQAKDAIQNPALSEGDFISNPFEFSTDALEKMLDYLTESGTEDIESFQLQILCRYVEEIVIKNKLEDNELRHISANHLGDIKNIFEEYYNNLISNVDPGKAQNVKRLFEEGLIFEKDKIRVALYKGQITSMYGIDEVLLKKLVDTHLVRSETDANGMEKFELSHDSLIEPILKAKGKRMAEEEAKILEKNAELQKIKFRKRLQLYASIFIIIVLLSGFVIYRSYQNAKIDRLKIDFLVAEREWFHFLDTAQKKEVLNKDFLFLVDKDSVRYSSLKYAYKCAALANKMAIEGNPYSALRLAYEGLSMDSNTVTKRSLANIVQKNNIHLPSASLRCRGVVNNAMLSGDKKSVIAVSSEGIFWYDVETQQLKEALTSEQYLSDNSTFSPDGSYLIYARYNKDTAYVLNLLERKQPLKIKTNYNDTLYRSIAFDISADNKSFILATSYNHVKRFSITGIKQNEYDFPIDQSVTLLSLAPDQSFAAAMWSGAIFLSSDATKALSTDPYFDKNLHSEVINSVSFSRDGKFMLTGSSDKEVKIWDVTKNKVIQILKHSAEVLRCRFSANDSTILVGEKGTGAVTRWLKQDSRSAIGGHAQFNKNPIQLVALDSLVTSVNFYNGDQGVIASSDVDISLWNLNNTVPLAQQVARQIIPPLILKEKLEMRLLTLQDLLYSIKKKEVLEGITMLNDSLIDLNADGIFNENKQIPRECINLIHKLFLHLEDCKEDNLSKLDSFNLFVFVGNIYQYTILLDQDSASKRFDKDNLDSLIKYRQHALRLDTLYADGFNNLVGAYLVPMSFYLENKQYDSLLIWNTKILEDNPQLKNIDEIQESLMVIYQYDVSFRMLNSDTAGAKKAIENWPAPHTGVNYVLSNNLVEICTKNNYRYVKEKMINDYSQSGNDMAYVVSTLLSSEYDKKNKMWSANTIKNLNKFYDDLTNSRDNLLY